MNVAKLRDAHIRDTAMSRLLGPSAAELTAKLPDIGDGLAAACADLARDPRPDAAEILAANLNGAARYVMRVREAMLRESEPPTAA